MEITQNQVDWGTADYIKASPCGRGEGGRGGKMELHILILKGIFNTKELSRE